MQQCHDDPSKSELNKAFGLDDFDPKTADMITTAYNNSFLIQENFEKMLIDVKGIRSEIEIYLDNKLEQHKFHINETVNHQQAFIEEQSYQISNTMDKIKKKVDS